MRLPGPRSVKQSQGSAKALRRLPGNCGLQSRGGNIGAVETAVLERFRLDVESPRIGSGRQLRLAGKIDLKVQIIGAR